MLILWLGRASATGALLVLASCGSRTELYLDSTPDAGAPDRLAPDAASDESAIDAPVSVMPEVVLFGGFGVDGEVLNDTWVFDGAHWSRVVAPNPPSPRFQASMAGLSVGGRDEVVLFGGQAGNGGPVVDETWVFDGTTWSPVTTAASPPARMNASIATLAGRVVLFGGTSAGAANVLGDTWTFDGTSWSAVTGMGPSPRADASMGTLGNEVVLFGGADATGAALGDTWTFDGTIWKQVSATSGPPARLDAQAATLGAAFYVFGGEAGNAGDATGLGDTWFFDGTRWTAAKVPGGPLPLPLAGTAVFGGRLVGLEAGGSGRGETTWSFDGASWSRIGGVAPFSERVFMAVAALP